MPWRADVFRGAPQDKNSATFGTLGVNYRARKRMLLERPVAVSRRAQPEHGHAGIQAAGS